VDSIIHLASAEGHGPRGDLLKTDIEGTRNLAEAASDAGVKRFVYVSHLGADRMSAFAALKAKGIAEEHIRRSGIPHTILRSSIIFGPEDRFTVPLTRLLRAAPGFFPLPSGGSAVIQPLWIEDLVTCILWAFEKPEMENQTYEIGGSEYFPLRQAVETLMDVNQRRRLIVPFSKPAMNTLIIALDAMFSNFPFSSYSLDYFSLNRTCPVDNLTRFFGLMPARFTYRLEYLRRVTLTQRLSRWTNARTKRIAERLRERFPSLRPPE
jgi:NADH dehydrogenase